MSQSGAAEFAKAVIAAVTWRRIFTAWMLGFALYIVRAVQNGPHAPANFWVSGLVITNLGALLVLLAALAADEAVRRGARAWLAICVSLAAASILTALGQWYIRGWFHLFTSVNQPGVRMAVQRTQIIFVAADVLIFGGFAMLAFLNRRTSQRILEGVRGAELRSVHLERQLTESRFAAARAQINPNVLFESLAEIRGLYSRAAPQADQRLDELIDRLQATVTSTTIPAESRRAPR